MLTLEIRPTQAEDADRLFPLIYQSPVTDTLLWDGPTDLEDYRQGLAYRAHETHLGNMHSFTLVEKASQSPIGMVDIHPDENKFRGDIGIWIGQAFHGRGYGTQAVRWLLAYGFGRLEMHKIEAQIYTGNSSSRRIFEKNGFIQEGLIRKASLKRGQAQDDWLMGITREDYFAWTGSDWQSAAPFIDWIVHLCTSQAWQAAQTVGAYRAESLASEGFIHCSRPGQMLAVANAFYRGQPDLVLLWIDPLLIEAEVRWEQVGEQVFPHLYGPLNLDAVAAVRPFEVEEDKVFRRLPEPS
jgi:uncharacterized protein (DUF952 family)/RimJ/RimL family protein N-acetyltransferase